MTPHVFTVFCDWEGHWAVRTGAQVVVYSAPTQSAAEAYAVDQARRWPPSQVRVLGPDHSLERVWHHASRT